MRLIWNMPPPLLVSCAATPRAGAGRLAAMARLNCAASLSTAASCAPRSRRLAATYAARSPSIGGLGFVGAATTGGAGGGGTMAGACGLGAVTTGGGRRRATVLCGLGGDGQDACVWGAVRVRGWLGGASRRACRRSVGSFSYYDPGVWVV